MAGFDKVDPADLCLSMSSLQCCPRACVGKFANDGRVAPQAYRELPARELDEGIPVVREYALYRRTEVVGKVCVLTS